MKKNMKILLLILITVFSYKLEVNAATLHASDEQWSEFGGHIKKLQDDVEGVTYVYKLWLDSDTPAFCVDYGADIDAGSASAISLTTYFENGLSSTKTQELVQKINEYIYFGYGSSGRTSQKYYLATQKLIWEAISQSGFYQSSYYSSKVESYSFSTIDFKLEGVSKIDLSSEVSAIESSIKNYYIKPSMCSSASKLELAVGESESFTDSNSVLSNYQVTCSSGLSCQTDGNTLTVTAVSEASDQTITFTKNKVGSDAVLYKLDSDGDKYQEVVSGASLGPVSCNFGIDTYKNVQTSDAKIATIIIIGILCGIMSYVLYTSKKMLDGLK